jgi:hypothetical protein
LEAPSSRLCLPASGRVIRYLEFEIIQAKRNRDLWVQTPISDHCGAFLIL